MGGGREALEAKGYEIDTDQAVRRIIRSLEGILSDLVLSAGNEVGGSAP